MKRRDVLRLTGAGLAAGALYAPGLGTAFAQSKMVLKATDVHPLGYPTVEAVERMGKKLEAATNGRLSIQMYPSMQLGGEKELIEQAQVGALAIARISVGPMGLCWMNGGTRNVYNSKKPIKSVDDLKGLKIRMMGNPVFVDTMNSLGGNGVAMGFDQLINAMQTGVVDGAENNEPSYMTGQHFRYAKYYSMTGHLMIPEILVFSKRIFQSLSKEDQDLILKVAKEAQQEQRTLWYAMEKKSVDEMKKAGVEITDVADKKQFQAAVKPVWDKYGAQHAALIQRIQDVK